MIVCEKDGREGLFQRCERVLPFLTSSVSSQLLEILLPR
jgi:hypothetical protein